MESEISAAELSQSLSSFFLIDLMSKGDFAGNHIPGAVNIPVDELENRVFEIPKDKNIVVPYRKGLMKSDMALEHLSKLGFSNVKKLTRGTTNWFDSLK